MFRNTKLDSVKFTEYFNLPPISGTIPNFKVSLELLRKNIEKDAGQESSEGDINQKINIIKYANHHRDDIYLIMLVTNKIYGDQYYGELIDRINYSCDQMEFLFQQVKLERESVISETDDIKEKQDRFIISKSQLLQVIDKLIDTFTFGSNEVLNENLTESKNDFFESFFNRLDFIDFIATKAFDEFCNNLEKLQKLEKVAQQLENLKNSINNISKEFNEVDIDLYGKYDSQLKNIKNSSTYTKLLKNTQLSQSIFNYYYNVTESIKNRVSHGASLNIGGFWQRTDFSMKDRLDGIRREFYTDSFITNDGNLLNEKGNALNFLIN